MLKRVIISFAVLGVIGLCVVIGLNLWVTSFSNDRIYKDIESVPAEGRVAIVLGARVGKGGVPSNTLYDRTITGVELYRAGKVSKLLMSGGDSEPEVMKKLAIGSGVSGNDIILDDQGLRTYESCSRAKNEFAVESAVIVTQDYHLARSIYLCQNLGVDVIGFDSKRREYEGEKFLWVREYFSRTLAWIDINF